MLVVHTSDLHIDYRRYGRVNPKTGLNTAWESSHACWMAACQWAVDNNADAFIFGGDGFTNGRPSPEASELVAEGFRVLSDAGIPAVVVRGNHELISVPSTHRDINQRFADIPGTIIVDEPQNIFLACGLQITAVPWPRRHSILRDIPTEDMSPTEINHMVGQLLSDTIEELGEDIDPRLPAVFAGHFTVSNASLGTDRRGSEVLVHAVFEEPMVAVHTLTDGPWQHAALGHIHKRQQVGGRVWYVGSPNRVDFSEEHDDKGFHAVRIDVDDVAARGADAVAEVELVPTPARVLRTLHVVDGPPAPEDLGAGTLVKAVLADGERVPPPEFVAAVERAGAHIVKVDARPVSVRRDSAETLAVEVSELDGLKKWMEKNELDADSWDDLLAAAQDLIDEDKVAAVDEVE